MEPARATGGMGSRVLVSDSTASKTQTQGRIRPISNTFWCDAVDIKAKSFSWANSKRPERGHKRKRQDKEQESLSPSRSIRWGNSRRQEHKDMRAKLRNGGCLTSFPASPSPSPFPCNTLPSTDWAVVSPPVIVRGALSRLLHAASLVLPWLRRCGSRMAKNKKWEMRISREC